MTRHRGRHRSRPRPPARPSPPLTTQLEDHTVTESKIAKSEQRKRTVARYATRRRERLAVVKEKDVDFGHTHAARRKLNRMPPDASPTRIRSRGGTSGRPRGVVTRFELDRIGFRHEALGGELPGIREASW